MGKTFIGDPGDPDSRVQGIGPQDPASLDSATEIGQNDNYILGEAEAGEGAGLVLHPKDRRPDQSEISVNVEEDAMDGGDHRSGVAVSIHDEAAIIADEGAPKDL